MIVNFLTRFSIFDPKLKAWQLNKKNNVAEYKKKLFDPKRLTYRINNFEKICLKSILSQKYTEWKWHIGISDQLPEEFQHRLYSLCEDSRIVIYKVNGLDSFINMCDQKHNNYATVRLDDDDGLNTDFCSILLKYKEEKNTIVSFPYGRSIVLDNNNIVYGSDVFYKNIALGLSAINFNIFRAGNHSLVHQKYKVIYDNSTEMYYLNCGEYCDTQRKFQ